MIEQQYYTRERGGLFNQTDGYDTVAKSPQLKLEYIKKVLHPLCSYDIPSELQQVGEQDESKYPPSMIIIPGGSGELIVGQAVYKAKDFTGQRSTFFMHNFILSEYEKHRFTKEPEKLFGINAFKTSFNSGDGRQLPTLAGIAYDGNNPYFLERERLFGKLGMSQEIFNKLIYATFIAATSKKKVFIILDVNIEELGQMAKALLYHLYTVLPWQITEELGICTYANKMEAKKNIQITFLDKNALRYDTKQGKDLIFDFVNKRYPSMESDIEEEPYIRGAINYGKNKMAWEKINYWINILSTTLKDKSERTIAFYSRVITVFEMSMYLKAHKGYDLSHPKVRKGLMKQVLEYLQSDKVDEIRKELFEVMDYIIRLMQEEIGHYKLINNEELKALLCFKLLYCRNREQEEHCIQILLHLLTVTSRNKDYAYIYNLLDEVHHYGQMYKNLFEAVYNNDELRKQIIYYLINESFKEVKALDELIQQMEAFEEVGFILLKDQYYAQVVYDKFGECLRGIGDLMSFLEQLQKWANMHKETIYINLLEQGEYYFLEHIQLKDIKKESILCNLKFNRSYPLENYEVIQSYQKLKTDLSYMSPNKIKVSNKVQELVKMFYKQRVTKNDFYMLVYAFLELDPETYKPKLNIRRVLTYLSETQMDMALEFIIWAKGQEIYIDKSRFDNQVIRFFVTLKQKGGKVNKELIETKLGGQAKTKALCEKILYALKPNFAKWLGSHGKLVAGMGVFILASIGGIYMFCNYQKDNQIKVQETFRKQEVTSETIKKLMPNCTMNEDKINALIKEQFGMLYKADVETEEVDKEEEKNKVVDDKQKLEDDQTKEESLLEEDKSVERSESANKKSNIEDNSEEKALS